MSLASGYARQVSLVDKSGPVLNQNFRDTL